MPIRIIGIVQLVWVGIGLNVHYIAQIGDVKQTYYAATHS
jgi:hypothetical protein